MNDTIVNHECKGCGAMLRTIDAVESHECPGAPSPAVSVADETLDQMIQGASVPDLASLMRKAKDQGVIGPVSVYGEGAPSS